MSDIKTASGRRIILVVYGTLIAIAGVMGAILGVILPEQKGVAIASLGPLSFPVTPVTFAIYGMISLAVMLGILLGAVQFVSRYDEASKFGE
ncbi:MAG: DUF7520 family protein [Halanaeroarchaeum sp.]